MSSLVYKISYILLQKKYIFENISKLNTQPKKILTQFSLQTLLFFTLVVHSSITNLNVLAVPEAVNQVDTITFTITKSDFGFPNNGSNYFFNFSKGSGNETFWYSGWAFQTSTLSTNPWFNIKGQSQINAVFKQETEVGSSINQWRLTSLTLNYAKHGDIRGQTNNIYVNNIFMFSYVINTNEISKTALDANSDSYTKTFTYAQNIKTFSIIPKEELFISSMVIEYSIDYSNC